VGFAEYLAKCRLNLLPEQQVIRSRRGYFDSSGAPSCDQVPARPTDHNKLVMPPADFDIPVKHASEPTGPDIGLDSLDHWEKTVNVADRNQAIFISGQFQI
jgi:hypothetical protein